MFARGMILPEHITAPLRVLTLHTFLVCLSQRYQGRTAILTSPLVTWSNVTCGVADLAPWKSPYPPNLAGKVLPFQYQAQVTAPHLRWFSNLRAHGRAIIRAAPTVQHVSEHPAWPQSSSLFWSPVRMTDRVLGMGAYRIPASLNDFQRQMYEHLVEYKWNVLGIKEPGLYEHPKKKGEFIPYDTMFPDELRDELHPVYRPVVDIFKNPRDPRYCFKVHPMAVHMASSQVACANLFLPLMAKPEIAARVLSTIKKDMAEIATDRLDSGFAIEFWNDFDVMPKPGRGLLRDHSSVAGTDADIAIAYKDKDGLLCLWLIEHKLTEKEFTTCGGYKSKRNQDRERCEDGTRVVADPHRCHYHSACGYEYWNITLANRDLFHLEGLADGPCPFKGGMNQLWRNQLLATAIETSPDWPYKRVYFSVVHHPGNKHLNDSMKAFERLVGESDRFSWFPSRRIIDAARTEQDADIRGWVNWYEKLYALDIGSPA